MLVIGLAGPAGSGKSTIGGMMAAALVDLGHTVKIDAFGVAVKREARSFGWNGVKDDAGRGTLQNIGMKGRAVNVDKWVGELLKRNFYNITLDAEYLIIPDVRFANEAKFVRHRGTLFHVVGRGGLSGAAGKHVSENGVEKADGDMIVQNTQPLEAMAREIAAASAEISQARRVAGCKEFSAGQ